MVFVRKVEINIAELEKKVRKHREFRKRKLEVL